MGSTPLTSSQSSRFLKCFPALSICLESCQWQRVQYQYIGHSDTKICIVHMITISKPSRSFQKKEPECSIPKLVDIFAALSTPLIPTKFALLKKCNFTLVNVSWRYILRVTHLKCGKLSARQSSSKKPFQLFEKLLIKYTHGGAEKFAQDILKFKTLNWPPSTKTNVVISEKC